MTFKPFNSAAIGGGLSASGTRRLGTLLLSQLGAGCLPFGAIPAQSGEEVVRTTFSALHGAGVRYFDVAPMYGLGVAERRLGDCLQQVPRHSVVLSTKVGRLLEPGPSGGDPLVRYDYSYDGTLRSLEASLGRLRVDAVDIVFIHDVNRRWHGDEVERRYAEALKGAYVALAELRSQGRVKAIGVGVNDWTILERFCADGDFDCFMLAGRYTLLDYTALESFLPLCLQRRIAVLMAAPFNSGLLASGARAGATYFHAHPDPEILERTRRIEAVCDRHSVPIAAAALQFPLAHPAVASVVAGMSTPIEALANIRHCSAPIPAAFWQELKHEGLIPEQAPLPDDPVPN